MTISYLIGNGRQKYLSTHVCRSLPSSMDSSQMEGSANCPICGKAVALESINNHIDICLLPGGKELHAKIQPSEPTGELSGNARQQAGSMFTRKRQSPSKSGKQSLLAPFDKSETPHRNPENQPPAKSRKLALSSTPNSSKLHPVRALDTSKSTTSEDVNNTASTGEGVGELKAPLAEVMRPNVIDDYVGQESAIGKNAILRTVLESGQVPSMIFWGPPGCGKTTLARIVSRVSHEKLGTRFTQLSATTAGVKDVKEVVQKAKNEWALLKRRTILFIDEIHRFNKLQQDTFLPHVEDGTITLLGATTENPSFQLNSALLSRCKVIVLEKLEAIEIEGLLRRALDKLGAAEINEHFNLTKESNKRCRSSGTVWVEPEAISTLSQFCDGDARSALNSLQLAVQAKRMQHMNNTEQQNLPDAACTSCAKEISVTVQDAKDSLQRSHLLYDRAGDEHYNCISALHKSMRGSDPNASLYWLARMLSAGEDPLYVARRVVRFASEDVGLADPNALPQAIAAFQGCQFIGMPECEVILAQAVVYMARAPKSIEVYKSYGVAKQCVKEHKGPLPSVPLHLRNAPTKLMKQLGYGKDYKYNPTFADVHQQYMPQGMEKADFFHNH